MKNIMRNGFIVLTCMYLPTLVHATEFITLEIDPSKSWIQDTNWVEAIPNSDGVIPDLFSLPPLGQPFPEAIYHEGERHYLTGSIDVILGRDYYHSIEIEERNVLPGTLPSGRDVVLSIDSMTLKNGIFPDNSFELPPGAICNCSVFFDPLAPNITGVFDGDLLSVDYVGNEVSFASKYYVSWIGDAPPNGVIINQAYMYHLEAKVVPLPPAFILLISALGSLSLFQSLCSKKVKDT